MSKNDKLGITPNRFNQIFNYNHYVENNNVKKSYVFESLISVDNRFFILRDELFDINEQKSLGNVWDSIDTFKTLFTNIKTDNRDFEIIKESWSNLVLTESNQNLHILRDILLEFNIFNDTWLGRSLKDSGQGLKDFVSTSFEGIKKLGVSIGKGEWSEIINLLGKGILFVLRKLKDAAYSTLGVIVDAILVATGIGKGAQMATWGLITALDVYQISTNNWPSNDDREEIWKYMDLGFDLLGLVFAGVAAKGARAIFKPLQGLSTKNLAVRVSQNPKLKSTVQKIFEATKNGGSRLKSVESSISKKWPSGAKFINSILGVFGNIVKKLQTYLGQILSKSNLKGIKNTKQVPGKGFVKTTQNTKDFVKRGGVAGAASSGLMYGIDKLGGDDESFSFDDVDFSALPISDDEF